MQLLILVEVVDAEAVEKLECRDWGAWRNVLRVDDLLVSNLASEVIAGFPDSAVISLVVSILFIRIVSFL